VTQSLISDAGFDPALGADEQLRSWFGKKPNLGLETIQQQMAVFAGLDETAALQALAETFSADASDTRALRSLANIWARGDVAAMTTEFYVKTRDKYPAFFAALLQDRNRQWQPLLQKYLAQDGVTFVAVGAGHLVGDGSVIVLLTQQGYDVRKVQ
jgi:uncharacterized protein